MKLSIVVCTRNRPDLIGECLQALSQGGDADTEVLVVDQSTDDATGRIVSANPGIRRMPTSSVGLSRARNLGIAQSSGEIVAFTDDDCVPAPDWADSIVREFDRSPEISAVYGRSLPWTKPAPGERPVAVKTSTARKVFKGRHNPWDLGHGCNMAFRREVFQSAGTFDEVLGPGGTLRNCDDADFTYRLLRSGFSACYSPDVLVYHKQFRHGEDLWKLERDYGIGAGAFYMKHLRCHDYYILKLILDRWWKAGTLHIFYGLLTGRKGHLRLGWSRIFYSILGMWKARKVVLRTDPRTFLETPAGGFP